MFVITVIGRYYISLNIKMIKRKTTTVLQTKKMCNNQTINSQCILRSVLYF